MSEMVEITFVSESTQEEIKVNAHRGELLTQAAYRGGIVIQQTCGGTPSCTDCKVKVIGGDFEHAFEPAEGPELRLLGNIYHITHERLSCQAIIKNSSKVCVPDAKKLKDANSARSQKWLEEKRKQQPRKQQKNQKLRSLQRKK